MDKSRNTTVLNVIMICGTQHETEVSRAHS